jgi:hypothetical protein
MIQRRKKGRWLKKIFVQREPEPPPVNTYPLFLKTFLRDASHIDPEFSEKEAPRYRQNVA